MILSLKSPKQGVGSGSAPKCQGSPTLVLIVEACVACIQITLYFIQCTNLEVKSIQIMRKMPDRINKSTREKQKSN
jgi:hypothetical protein